MHHNWPGYAEQKNWVIDNIPLESTWLLILDADEIITRKLRNLMINISSKPINEVPENGFFINRVTYFPDQPIHHCGYSPSWYMRFFKRGKGRYEDRRVHEHVVIDDPNGNIKEPMLHWDRLGLEHKFAKHTRYSTLKAQQLFFKITNPHIETDSSNVTAETRRRSWRKRHVTQCLPLPSLRRFFACKSSKSGYSTARSVLGFVGSFFNRVDFV